MPPAAYRAHAEALEKIGESLRSAREEVAAQLDAMIRSGYLFLPATGETIRDRCETILDTACRAEAECRECRELLRDWEALGQ